MLRSYRMREASAETDEDVAALPFFVGIPVPIKQAVEDQGFDFRFLVLFEFLRVAVLLACGRAVALGIDIAM